MTKEQHIPAAVLRHDDEGGPLPQMVAQRREQLRQEREALPSSNRRAYWADIISRGQSGTFLTSAQCQEVASLLVEDTPPTCSKEHLRWRKAFDAHPNPWVLEVVRDDGEIAWTLMCAERPLGVVGADETTTGHCIDCIELKNALAAAVKVANEARECHDRDQDMRTMKLLIALSGHLPKWRADTDRIHDVLRRAVERLSAPMPPEEPAGECVHNLIDCVSTLTVIDPYKAKCRVCYNFFDLPLDGSQSSENGDEKHE